MKNRGKKLFSAFLTICILMSMVCVGTSVSAETTMLKSESLYSVKDNYVFEVSVETTLSTFVSNFNTAPTVYLSDGTVASDADIISTGCYFTYSGTKYYIIVVGDVDSSGKVDSTDYLRIKNFFLGKIQFADAEFKAADIDNTDKIDSTDYLKIKSAFLGSYLLPSSKEYMSRKTLISQSLQGLENLAALKEFDAVIDITATTDTGSFDIDGTFRATDVGSSSPDFSFILNASADGITYPISETYYGNGVLYTKDNGVKYKVDANYAEVSKFLSSYLPASPVSADGEFILVPAVNREKILYEDYSVISSIIKNVGFSINNATFVYSFETDNILHTSLFYDIFTATNGSEYFGSINIREMFESVTLSGTSSVNSNGIMTNINVDLALVLSDKAVNALGYDTPKTMDVNMNLTFKNIGSVITVEMPNDSEYTKIDNIYTRFACSAYTNVFDITSALSTSYKETIKFGSSTAQIISTTNAKNVESGIELYKSTQKTINGTNSTTNLYIGNSKYITETNGSKTTIDLNTSNQSIEKNGIFFTPHYDSVGDINSFATFSLTENADSFTLNYTLNKDYALSLLKNSDVMDISTFSTDLGIYSDSAYTLSASSGSITFSKIDYEVISNNVSMSFNRTDGTVISYTYEFVVSDTNYNSVKVDSSLLG